MKRANKHFGSSLDDFLRKEVLLDRVEGLAAKQVIALHLQAEAERQGISQRSGAAPTAAGKRAS